MVGVLLGLCVTFSLATITEQQPNSIDAAKQVRTAAGLRADTSFLVVASTSEEDRQFVDALRLEAEAAGVERRAFDARVSVGTPQDARRALDRSEETVLTLLQGPDTRGWKLFEGIQEKFPSKQLRVVAPVPERGSNFLKTKNLINIANQIVVIAILAIGMTLVILTGGVDLSVGSLIALSAVLCTMAIREWGGAAEATPIAMVLCGALALAICACCGAVSGILIVGFQLPPFIATMGMMLIASGFAFILSQGQSIDAVPESFVYLGRGTWLGLPVAVLLMLLLYALAHGVMKHTVYGRWLYALGGNAEAARLCGIRVRQLVASTYVLSGLLAGLGGLVMASRLKSGDAKYGAMYELYVIAAVVVGGTSLRGGHGSIAGTLIGALIIAVIENGMNLVQVESYTQKVVFGAVILVAVLLERRSGARAN